jgi:hypothetical protein
VWPRLRGLLLQGTAASGNDTHISYRVQLIGELVQLDERVHLVGKFVQRCFFNDEIAKAAGDRLYE